MPVNGGLRVHSLFFFKALRVHSLDNNIMGYSRLNKSAVLSENSGRRQIYTPIIELIF